MKLRKHTKSLFGILLALAMLASLLPASLVSAADPEGGASITLEAPKDPESSTDEQVDLEGMKVSAYLILVEDERDSSLFTVHSAFKNFFSAVETAFYDGESPFVKDGKIQDGKGTMYLTYADSKQMQLSATDPGDSVECIKLETSKLRSLVLNATEREYFAAALMEKILEAAVIEEAAPLVTHTENAEKLAKWLRAYAEDPANSSSVVTKTSEAWKSGTTSLTLDGLNLGYWLVVSDDAPGNVANVEAVFRLSRKTGEEVKAQLKLETQKLEKTVQNANHKPPEDTAYGEEATAAAGDILNYKVTTKLPDLWDYDGTLVDDSSKYQYQITDTMQNQRLVAQQEGGTYAAVSGTDLIQGAFTVTLTYEDSTPGSSKKGTITFVDKEGPVSHPEYLLKDYLKVSDSTYGSYTEKKQSFVLEFDIEQLRKLELEELGVRWKEAEVTLAYSAELTSDAVWKNGNDVVLSYTNDPNSTDLQTLPDHTTVYSYGLDIQKDFEGLENPSDEFTAAIKDVTFELYPATLEGSKVTAGDTAIDMVGEKGSYNAADSKAALKVSELELSETGNLHIYGLDEGYYVLKETKTHTGYAKVGEIVVYLDADGLHLLGVSSSAKEGDVSLGATNNSDEATAGSATENYLQFTVVNRQGMSLPETGGPGTWMLLIGGVLLIMLAGALVISRKKRGTAE